MTILRWQNGSIDRTPLVSLLVPSRRPHQFEGLIGSLQDTVSDPASVEVIAKIDDDNIDAVRAYRTIARSSSVPVHLVIGPRLGGVFTLWVGMEEGLTHANEHAYFVMALTDEGRFLTRGWDDVLRGYVGLFDDHVFRLRLSKVTKLIHYANYLTCSTMPESFPIFTRRWLELTEGFTRFSYGFDAYQQAVATQLAIDDRARRDIWNSGGRFRDVPVSGIELGGIEFNKDVSEVETCTRMMMGVREWLRLVSFSEQEHVSYLATRLRVYIAAKQAGRNGFRLRHDRLFKRVSAETEAGEVLASQSYRIARIRAYWFYWRTYVGLLPARLRYLRHEMMLASRMRRGGVGKPRRKSRLLALAAGLSAGGRVALHAVKTAITAPIGAVLRSLRWIAREAWRFAFPALKPMVGWALPALPALRRTFVRSARVAWRRFYPLVDFVRACRKRLASAPRRMARFGWRRCRATLIRLRLAVRTLRDLQPLGLVVDQLLRPVDWLSWSAPPLLDHMSSANPLGTFSRLKRLAYPVAPRDVMESEQQRIGRLKQVTYEDKLF